jgi:hypothetical protein
MRRYGDGEMGKRRDERRIEIWKNSGKESVMKEKSRGLKETKKAPQKSLKEKRKEKKEKKNR